jgi:hypothetical protein
MIVFQGHKGKQPMRHDPIQAILADLMRRVDGVADQRGHLSAARVQDEVDQIRHIARIAGFDRIEALAGTLETALSLQGLAPIMLSYLDLLRDAIGDERTSAVILPVPPRIPTAASPLHA